MCFVLTCLCVCHSFLPVYLSFLPACVQVRRSPVAVLLLGVGFGVAFVFLTLGVDNFQAGFRLQHGVAVVDPAEYTEVMGATSSADKRLRSVAGASAGVVFVAGVSLVLFVYLLSHSGFCNIYICYLFFWTKFCDLCLCFRLSVLPACLPACMSVYLYVISVCLSVCLPVASLPVCVCVFLSSCLPAYLPVFLPTCLSSCLPACLPVCLPVCLPTSLSACLSACFIACLSA